MFLAFLGQRSSIITISLLKDKSHWGLSSVGGPGVVIKGKSGFQRSGIDFWRITRNFSEK
jgi:hypothetical protein